MVYLPVLFVIICLQLCIEPAVVEPGPDIPDVLIGDASWGFILAPKSVDVYNFSTFVPTNIFLPLPLMATQVYVKAEVDNELVKVAPKLLEWYM